MSLLTSSSRCVGEAAVTDATLYQRLGGYEAIEALIDRFYLRLLQDARLRRFFVSLQLDPHVSRFTSYFVDLLGGQERLDPAALARFRRLVAERGINRGHLSAFLEHLEGALGEQYGDDQLSREVLGQLKAVGEGVLGQEPSET